MNNKIGYLDEPDRKQSSEEWTRDVIVQYMRDSVAAYRLEHTLNDVKEGLNALDIPTATIVAALARLEERTIIVSQKKGRTKYFILNEIILLYKNQKSTNVT